MDNLVDENKRLQEENLKLQEEIDRLSKSLEGHKKSVYRWRLIAEGEKNYNRKSRSVPTIVRTVNLIINDVDKFEERMVVDTDIPSSITNKEAKEIFKALNFEYEGEKYIVKEANKGTKNIWSIVVVK